MKSGTGLETRASRGSLSNDGTDLAAAFQMEARSVSEVVSEEEDEASMKRQIEELMLKEKGATSSLLSPMGRQEIVTGKYGNMHIKELTSLTNDRGVNEMKLEDLDLFMRRLQEILKTVTKGGRALPMNLLIDQNESNKINKLIEFILEQIDVALFGFYKDIEDEESNKKTKKDGDDNDDSIKLENLKRQRDILIKEKATISVYYKQKGVEGLVQRADELKEFEAFKTLKEMVFHGNQKLLELLLLLKINEGTKADIMYAIDNPYGKTKTGGMIDVFGLANSASTVFDRLRTRINLVTVPMFVKHSHKLMNKEINFDELDNGGFKKYLTERDKDLKEVMWMMDEILSQAGGVDFSGLFPDFELVMFWDLLMKIEPNALEENSTSKGNKNYEKTKDQLARAYQRMTNSKATVKEKYGELQAQLFQIDVLTKYEKKVGTKDNKKDFALNVNGKEKNLSKRNGKDKAKFKETKRAEPKGMCNDVLRSGFCSKKGCKYKGMTQLEYNSRQVCFKEASEAGSCPNGNFCLRLHPNDPEKMTDEMKRKCEHLKNKNGESVNAADEEEEIILDGEGSARE